MEIDESGWRDIDERLTAMAMPASEQQALVDHLTARLVGHFGADTIECHSGKDDPRRHAMSEVAAAALAHLGDVLDRLPSETVTLLVDDETIGTVQPAPWDDHWRTQSRTASWRS